VVNLIGASNGVFEFFIKDHLGSTRMVLTEEVQKEYYTATMEYSARTSEEPFFGKVLSNGSTDQTNELAATRIINSNPATAAWPNHTSDFVKLTGANSTTMIGPNMMLKVMAGDLITTSAKYYYTNNNNTSGSTDPLVSVPSSIINALTSPNKGSVIGKTFSGGIQPNLQTSMYNFLKNTEPSNGNTNAPKAYVNIVFLDEQFSFIDKDVNDPGVGTDFMRVSSSDDPNASFPLIAQKAPKNGWVFVYLSNESVEPVYFDDFKVVQEHSRISEEIHYYPHGLKIASISSQSFNKLDSKYGFQGDYSEEEDETGWDEFYLRNYDPQIARWINKDPLNEFASPYIGMGNNPIKNVDATGGSISWLTPLLTSTIAGATIGALTAQNNGEKWWQGAIVGGISGAGVGLSLDYAFDLVPTEGNTTLWSYLSNSVITANVNILSKTAQGENFNVVFKSGLTGLFSGLATTYIQYHLGDKFVNKINRLTGHNFTAGNIQDLKDKIGIVIGGSINGFLDRMFSYSNLHKFNFKQSLFFGTAGAFEGLFGGLMGVLPQNKVVGNLVASTTTSIPGMNLRLGRAYLIWVVLEAAFEMPNDNNYHFAASMGLIGSGIGLAGINFHNLFSHFAYPDHFNIKL
jgi:RHS repeat-associated protein